MRADGTVEVNTNSEAYYLNQDRFADAPIPKGVDPKQPPVWKALSKTGRFEWHDHRMHYMGKGRPKQVADPAVRQKVFDWKVPLVVDGRKGSIDGDLLWTPPAGGAACRSARSSAFAGLVIALSIGVFVDPPAPGGAGARDGGGLVSAARRAASRRCSRWRSRPRARARTRSSRARTPERGARLATAPAPR